MGLGFVPTGVPGGSAGVVFEPAVPAQILKMQHLPAAPPGHQIPLQRRTQFGRPQRGHAPSSADHRDTSCARGDCRRGMWPPHSEMGQGLNMMWNGLNET